MSLVKKLLAVVAAVFISHSAIAQELPKHTAHQPQVKTPLTEVQLLQALRDGHQIVFGEAPSEARLAMAWAQVAFENGAGRLTFNYNLGNVKAVNSQAYYRNRWDGLKYRAFETAALGAAAYWEVVKRCNAAVVRFDRGHPVDAAWQLKRCGYYEAPVALYSHGLATLYNYARTRVFAAEARQLQEQQEMQDAINSELVRLMDDAARQAASSARGPRNAEVGNN